MKLKRRPTYGAALDRVARDTLFGTSGDFPRLVELDLDALRPRPDQPRRTFDEAALRELADSMARVGLLHPLLVRDAGGGSYDIVAGERRWRAARLLGRRTLYAIVTDGDPDEIALVENLQRQDLDPLEEADALARLMDRHAYTQAELGAAVGKSQGQVSATLRLLTLPARIREEYPTSDKRVPRSVLMELATIEDPARQLALWEQARAGALTVRAVREEKAAAKAPRVPAADPVPAVLRAVDRISRSLEVLQASRADLNSDQRSRLAALRRRIDALLG